MTNLEPRLYINKMDIEINLSAYFNRIGFKGQAKAKLETLKKLHVLHTQSIPFENLNPLLKIPVEIDIESIQDKIIHKQRGGYCFEHNLLFTHVLNSIGFNARPLAARVLIDRFEDDITTKSHALVLIELKGKKYIADTGFGSQSLTVPLELIKDMTQHTPHEDYRIKERDDYFILQASIKDEWKTLYRFTLQERHFIDFKVANWYTSTHPSSHFTQDLTVAIAKEACRHTLKNNIYKIHYLNKPSKKATLTNSEEIKKLLVEVFYLKIEGLANLDVVLENLLHKKQTP